MTQAHATSPLLKYQTIVADPPWPYDNPGPVGNGGRGSVNIDKMVQVGLRDKYSTMTIAEIADLRVPSDDECHLYLWTTNAFIVEAFGVAAAWGFKPKSFLTWGKVQTNRHSPSMKTGYWFRGATEHCIFAVKGKRRLASTEPTLLLDTRLPHSVKPQSFFDMVERCSPGPRLEMFARKARAGWDVWGNQAPDSIELAKE